MRSELFAALSKFLAVRKLQLSNEPFDDLVIPLKYGGSLRVPVVLLETETKQ